MPSLSPNEQLLYHEFLHQPSSFDYRFGHAAECHLKRILFKSLAGNNDDYLRFFFPNGPPTDRSQPWSLSSAQGAVDGAEYTAAAKGTACGHIFKNGESTYRCKTCAADDTCVLCAKCFESSDHEGHMVLISVSPGNSGCCDCGDREAWRREVHCSIHTATADPPGSPTGAYGRDKGKAAVDPLGAHLPVDLMESIRMTLARCIDYLCDVFSCSPEQLRLPKTASSILQDEREARLSGYYGEEPIDSNPEFALVLWNDEKHTVDDVQNQVARACARSKRFGLGKAMEVNDIGRSVVQYSTNLPELLRMAEIIEQLKVTVTIRSARDTFREQMCATIIDWIADISGCAVGNEPYVLRNIVCEELLKPWRMGSSASNKDIGLAGIDDHETEDNEKLRRKYRALIQPFQPGANVLRVELENEDQTNEDEDEQNNDDFDEDDDFDEMDIEDDDGMEIEIEDLQNAAAAAAAVDSADMDIDILDESEDVSEALEATLGGYPPPPPPAPGQRRRILTPAESDDGDVEQGRLGSNAPYDNVPRTPKANAATKRLLRPSKHWLEKPEAFRGPRPSEPCEDLWQRVRLDFLILYDLRLWKTLRTDLRHLYITTVVTIPHFKRILGLRFAGLYTALAQLYLIADREPDHSIINLSVQMLTTPTITQEVVARGNFLTNLMAILYTFLTTRQVGFPEDVSPKATLAFDAGAVTNRRMFHFFFDLRWLLQSELIHERLRSEPRYLLQFLDLVKLHQGVCPNLRATGEHVEYESDAWISASMIVKEINKLCKQVAVSFEPAAKYHDNNIHLHRAIRTVAQVTMINSFGYERKRFHAAELKDDLAWHLVGPFEHRGKAYSVPKQRIQAEPMSFHHPLHYLLSWLLEGAKGMNREEMRTLLQFSPDDLKDPWNATRTASAPANLTPDELLCAIFDPPLRTCAWLAQMKAGMWVRNGITLRHQAHTYRSVSHRDVGYQRDILMLQGGLVLCGSAEELPGERYLAQMVDRFEMSAWFNGDYSVVPGFEEPQQLDVIEDFLHLLIVALSERGNLMSDIGEKEQHDRMLKHDIAHALCFKPLSFSDLAGRVTEKVGESDDFNRVLESMALYRPPEGLSDTGTFELRPEYVETIDPYYAHYSRNQREEAENIYKKHMARKSGKKPEDVVYEPQLEAIETGLFSGLAAFTSTPLFTQVVGAALNFAMNVGTIAPRVQTTRVETFLNMALHLILLATIEDRHDARSGNGFIKLSTLDICSFKSDWKNMIPPRQTSIITMLFSLSNMDQYASCYPMIKHVLRKMQVREPEKLTSAAGALVGMLNRSNTGSPASMSVEDKERKKQEALARQARVMAQMKQQQNSFLQNQGLSSFDNELDDFEDDMSIIEDPSGVSEQRKSWSFPTGTCILCQEETDDQRLYGTFAFLGESNILRTTPVNDDDFLQEVVETPTDLDRSAEEVRPFGVAGKNKEEVQKITSDGKVINIERQGLSKGFPHQANNITGSVATSCGHIMHYSCFELYLTATQRRHAQQIARNHPERIECKEFICPLCKALGNTFLPVIWKAKECARDHELHAAKNFGDWLAEAEATYTADLSFLDNASAAIHRHNQVQEFYSNRSYQYVASMFAPSLVQSMQELSLENSADASPSRQYPLRRGHTLSRLFGLAYGASQNQGYNSEERDTTEKPTRMSELWRAYRHIDESIKINNHDDASNVNPVVALSRALGLTISSFEISQRGMGSNPLATSLLADLPEQTLTQLRIMSETIESYLAVNVLRSGSNVVARETIKKRDIITAQLFGVDSDVRMIRLKEATGNLLFQDDIFLFFADWLSFMAPDVAEASSILQLCYWAEIAKAVFVLKTVVERQVLGNAVDGAANDPQAQQFRLAVETMAMEDTRNSHPRHSLTNHQMSILRLMVDKYALAFLRKCTILMYVRYGLDFACPYDLDASSPELQRLTALLHLSPIEEMCTVYTTHSVVGEILRKVTGRWISQAVVITGHDPDDGASISIPHPAIFELVGLPKNYDALTEEAIRRRCPTTGKEVSDPAVCLMCGEIFCSQAVCCIKDRDKGGCYQHMEKCGARVGIFINIRKCMVLFAHGPGSGSFAQAPYLDKHGEPDPTLRRHHQLYLNQKRYDKLLRDVWLNHMVPTVISRKLEGDINPGGWETL